MSEELKFNPDQVANLNAYQVAGKFHPFTCPNRNRKTHRVFNGDLGALVATVRGWICPWCDYTQGWAHDFMCEPLPPDPVAEMLAEHRETTAVQQEREECAKVLDGFEQEFLSRAEESIQRNNPASARFEKSRALELKSYAAAIRRRGE